MLNIEIHGFYEMGRGDNVAFRIQQAVRAADEVRARIKWIFASWPCAKDIVVSIVDSDATDLNGGRQPFLRVWDTNVEEGEKIALRLRLEGFDVGFKKLDVFLPKPLYTLDEVKAELRLIIKEAESYNMIVAQLVGGSIWSARDFFVAELAAEPFRSLSQPTEEEMSQKFGAKDPLDFDESALRARFVRWHQMLAILGG